MIKIKNILVGVLSIGALLFVAGPFTVQAVDQASPDGCNADRSVVNVARSTASASVGETITFTVEAGNPISEVDDGCDITNRTMILTLPNGETEEFGPVDYPYPSALAIIGSVDYVAETADLVNDSWTATIAWTGIQKDGFDSVSTGSKGTSVVYIPLLLEVTKTAVPIFERTITWAIDKNVAETEHVLTKGGSSISNYLIEVDKTEIDSNYAVSGTITISNPALVATIITGVTDVMEDVGVVAVDCPVTFPYLLTSGSEIVCTYTSNLPDDQSRTNTITVTTTGEVEGDSAEAIVSFEDVVPTVIGFDQVTITDTNDAFGGPLETSTDVVYDYAVTFSCDEDAGVNINTATIVETEQSDDASVTVVCTNPAIDLEKATNNQDADTPTGPVVAVGDSVNWTYVVTNNGDVSLTNIIVSDDQGVTITCPQTTLTVGEDMTCTASGVAIEGQYANLGSVSASYENVVVTDSDLSHYFGEAVLSQWCSPGYWRQPHHLDSWTATGYTTNDLFFESFPSYSMPAAKKNPKFAPKADPSLLDVLSAPQIYGGEAFNLVGELLSEAHPDVNFTGERVEGSCPLN